MLTNEQLGEWCLLALEKTFNELIELPLKGEKGYNRYRSKLAQELYNKALANALDYVKYSDSW